MNLLGRASCRGTAPISGELVLFIALFYLELASLAPAVFIWLPNRSGHEDVCYLFNVSSIPLRMPLSKVAIRPISSGLSYAKPQAAIMVGIPNPLGRFEPTEGERLVE